MGPDPDLVVILSAVVASVIGGPIAWAIARRIGQPPAVAAPATLSANVERRLEHIEQAVDAIAVEMERVSEGQRFTTKLLAERSSSGVPGNGAPPAAPAAPAVDRVR
jgi:hypothetical protein